MEHWPRPSRWLTSPPINPLSIRHKFRFRRMIRVINYRTFFFHPTPRLYSIQLGIMRLTVPHTSLPPPALPARLIQSHSRWNFPFCFSCCCSFSRVWTWSLTSGWIRASVSNNVKVPPFNLTSTYVWLLYVFSVQSQRNKSMLSSSLSIVIPCRVT